jgi:CheY-like chemotaxis protein
MSLPLLLLTAGLWCLPVNGVAPTNVYEFPKSIPKPGSIQWEITHEHFKELQEQHRKRLSIPDAMGTNVSRSSSAYLINGPRIVTAPAPVPVAGSRMLLKMFFLIAVFIVAEILIIWKFAPHVLVNLNQRLNPWALPQIFVRDPSIKIRSEEKAFGEFLLEFHREPAAASSGALPEKQGLLNDFFARTKSRVEAQRKLLQEIGREASDAARQKMLVEIYSEVGELKKEAGFPEVLPLWQVASALEGLLRQLTEKIRNVTPSTLRAVGGALDLLDNLCVPELKPELLTDRPCKFLIVDDDLISRQALSLSLQKAFSQPDIAVDGESALAQIAKHAYDVIFLDVQMPGMDGFELCEKIRAAELNRFTPVVFVTGQSDFDARAKSTLSGGNDLMGKPFLTFEVTVKALTLALQGRLQNSAQKSLPNSGQRNGATVSIVPSLNPPPAPARSTVAKGTPLTATVPLDEMTTTFLARASKNIEPLQEICRKILSVANEEARQTMLVDGFLRVNSLLCQSDVEVVHPAYQMNSALEGLFRKLLENTKFSTPSALATIAAGVELLKDLCVPGMKADLALNPPIRMLVVDDDLVARRVLVGALQTVFEKPESVEDGESALALTMKKTFDVIFLDVQMPGMDGFEVCAKIRENIANHATPVVFVTGHGEFDARVRMSRNGGDDLVGKPFLTSEITVKVFTFALRNRLRQLDTQLNA